MADDTEVSMEDTSDAPSNAELAGRVDGLESKLDMILDRISGTEGQAHAAAQQHTEDRLDRPSSIADEIRQQLAEQQRQQRADAEKQGTSDRLAAVESSLAGMAEKVPEAPVRRVEKVMGWR